MSERAPQKEKKTYEDLYRDMSGVALHSMLLDSTRDSDGKALNANVSRRQFQRNLKLELKREYPNQ